MVTPVLKHIRMTNGAAFDSFVPEQADSFWLTLGLEIGTDDAEGADTFFLYITTPTALITSTARELTWPRHYLFVDRYNAEEIRNRINSKIAECARATFEETATALARFMHWEFEDYQPTELSR